MRRIYFTFRTVFSAAPFSASLMCIVVILNGIWGPVTAYLIQKMIDEISENRNITVITIYLICFIVAMLLLNLRELTEELIKINLVQKIRNKIMPTLFCAFETMPYHYIEDNEVTALISRIGSSPETKLYDSFHNMLFVPNLIFSLIGYSYIYIHLGVAFYIALVTAGIIIGLVSAKIYKLGDKLRIDQSKTKKYTSYISELLTSKKAAAELRVYQANEYLNQKWYTQEMKMLQERKNTIYKQQGLRLATIACELCFMAFIVLTSLYVYRSKMITFGLLVALISQIGSVLNIITWYIPYIYNSVKDNMVQTEELFTLLSYGKDETEAKEDIEIENDLAEIEFREVYFKYPGTEEYVLKGTSFVLSKGKKYALIGENGTGKSTIVKLLLGLYTPDKGEILFNGIEGEKLTREQRVHYITAVFQENTIFEMSVRENIGIGCVDKMNNTQEILTRISDTGIEKIMAADTIDKTIGRLFEEGLEFSDGEKRKLVTARGLLSESTFVILDEPTSSLDPMAEVNFYNTILHHYKEKSYLIISHRLGCAKLADVIFVLSDGRITESGTHDQLMEKESLYKKMFVLQSAWYKEDFHMA